MNGRLTVSGSGALRVNLKLLTVFMTQPSTSLLFRDFSTISAWVTEPVGAGATVILTTSLPASSSEALMPSSSMKRMKLQQLQG